MHKNEDLMLQFSHIARMSRETAPRGNAIFITMVSKQEAQCMWCAVGETVDFALYDRHRALERWSLPAKTALAKKYRLKWRQPILLSTGHLIIYSFGQWKQPMLMSTYCNCHLIH